jgi:hypothetical protein
MELRITPKVCAVCGKPLISHIIPEDAIKRFIASNECVYENENVVQIYLNSLSQKTLAGNSRAILRFCWITGKTPRELIAMGYNKLGLRDVSQIEKLLDSLENYCIKAYENPTLQFEKVFPKSSASLIAKTIKAFFRQNKLDCSKSTLKKLMKLRAEKQRTFIPTKKDIKQFRNYANPRDKLLIEFTTNVPLRHEEIEESLTWEKLRDLSKPYPMIIFFDKDLKGHGKDKYEGCLFVGIICESVRKKLIQRKEEEQQRFLDTKAIWESKGYKFTSEFNENTKVFLSSEVTVNEQDKTVSIEHLGYKSMSNLIDAIQRRSGIPLSLHKLRDYFQDQVNAHCSNEELKSVYANAFLAHKVQGTKRIYSHPETQYDKVLEVWKPLEPYVDLDFDESIVTIKLKERAKQLQEQGKTIEEIMDAVLKEQTQMMLTEVGKLKDSMIAEVKKAEEEHKRRTEK